MFMMITNFVTYKTRFRTRDAKAIIAQVPSPKKIHQQTKFTPKICQIWESFLQKLGLLVQNHLIRMGTQHPFLNFSRCLGTCGTRTAAAPGLGTPKEQRFNKLNPKNFTNIFNVTNNHSHFAICILKKKKNNKKIDDVVPS